MRYGDRIYTFLNDGRAVSGIREKDLNVAYELPEIAVANAAKPRPKSVDISKTVFDPRMGGKPSDPLNKQPISDTNNNNNNINNVTSPTSSTPSNTTPSTSPALTSTPSSVSSSNTTTSPHTDNNETKETNNEPDESESIMRLHLMFRRPNPANQTQQSSYMRSSPMVYFSFLFILFYSSFWFISLHLIYLMMLLLLYWFNYCRFCLGFQ